MFFSMNIKLQKIETASFIADICWFFLQEFLRFI